MEEDGAVGADAEVAAEGGGVYAAVFSAACVIDKAKGVCGVGVAGLDADRAAVGVIEQLDVLWMAERGVGLGVEVKGRIRAHRHADLILGRFVAKRPPRKCRPFHLCLHSVGSFSLCVFL